MKFFVFVLSLSFTATILVGQTPQKLNVLMISIDDLNDWTGYLKGHPQVRTPNLDRLMSQSVAFTNAFCNSPSCNPSRASLMLGKHPNSTGFYSNPHPPGLGPTTGNKSIDMRAYYPTKQTIPQYFRANGYYTWRTGKIFHYWGDWAKMGDHTNDLSFDVYSWGGAGDINPKTYLSGIDFGWSFTEAGKVSYMDWGAIDTPYTAIGEYGRATTTINELKKKQTKPFFMALGFYLPHLPWYYPKSILNLPDLAHIKNVEDVILPKVKADDFTDISTLGIDIAHGGGKPKSLDGKILYQNWHDAITKNGKWKEAIQAYIASTYFVDMQIGRVLDALESSEYKNNTIVVLWSDHGWMLGEKEAWNKYKPWEASVKVNFMIKAPGYKPAVVDKTVELLSIYPTLVELAGLPKKDSIDGISLVPLLKNTSLEWNHPVVTSHWDEDGSNGGWQSVRDNRYRYIRYVKTGDEELYDLQNDPEEWNNLIKNPIYQGVKDELSQVAPKTMTPLGTWGETPTPLSFKAKASPKIFVSFASGTLKYFFNNLNGAQLKLYTVDGILTHDFTQELKMGGIQHGALNLSSSIPKSGVYIVKLVDGKLTETTKLYIDKI